MSMGYGRGQNGFSRLFKRIEESVFKRTVPKGRSSRALYTLARRPEIQMYFIVLGCEMGLLASNFSKLSTWGGS